MKFDIISFGSAVLDLFVNTDLAEKGRFIAYPVGSKILIKHFKSDMGGGAINTSVAFSRLGLKTGVICKIGDDDAGKEIFDLLKKEKISFLGKIEKNSKSGRSIILDSKERNRTILAYKGVNNDLSLKDINPKKIKTKWIYYSSTMGKSFETQKKLAESLTKKGTKLAFNPSEYLIREKNLNSLLKITEILILNKEEAELLVKRKQSDLLKGLYELGPNIVVITDKNKLISCYDGKKKYFLKPHKVKVVERTGAGDAFASGFVSGIIVGKSISESLKLGLKESESVIRYFGSKNKLIKRNLK